MKRLFFPGSATAPSLLMLASMSRSTATASHLPSSSADDLFVLAKETRRIEPFSLEAALHANDHDPVCGDEMPASQDSTLTVSPEESMRLLQRAFSSDDEVTLDAPVPELPAGIPSPLGDEPRSDRISLDLSVSGERELPLVLRELTPVLSASPAPWLAPVRGPAKYHAVPDLPLLATQPPVSSVRSSVTPDVVNATRAAREAVRTARAAEARTRLIVLGIWGTAVTLAALLAFFATSS